MKRTVCEAEGCVDAGRVNSCEGDGRLHSHGMVHVNGNALAWLCNHHAVLASTWWAGRKEGKPVELLKLKV